MHWKPALIEALRPAWDALLDSYLLWGALGAAIAQAYSHGGLSLWRRFQQWAIGIVVMHLASALALAIWPTLWKPAVHILAFFVGFIAFAALGVWQKAAVEAGASAIKDVGVVWRQLMQGWADKLGARRTETPNTEGEG